MAQPKKRGPKKKSLGAPLTSAEYAGLMHVLQKLWQADMSLSVFMHQHTDSTRTFHTTPEHQEDRVIQFSILPTHEKANAAVYASSRGLSPGVPTIAAQRRLGLFRNLAHTCKLKGYPITAAYVSLSNVGREQVVPAWYGRPGPVWRPVEVPTQEAVAMDDEALHRAIMLAYTRQDLVSVSVVIGD